jgi:hypothetical protein
VVISVRLRLFLFRLLVLTLLWLPGSGRLVLDGLPFDSKVEFVFLVGVLSFGFAPKTVAFLKDWLSSLDNRRLFLVLGALILVGFIKFLTFIYSPSANGFEVCYRSVYAPLPSGECEKSYDQPFFSNGNFLAKISSVEKEINFGSTEEGSESTGTSTWRLPFMNDWGRLEPLWLKRLPFTADFAGTINVSADSRIPIVFLGDLVVDIDGQKESVKHYVGSPKLIFVSVEKGSHKLLINYRFSESNGSVAPNRQPEIIGEYASLQVYEPVSQAYQLGVEKTFKSISASDDTSLFKNLFFKLMNLTMLLFFLSLIGKLLLSYMKLIFVAPFLAAAVWIVINSNTTFQSLGLSRSSLLVGFLLGVGLWIVLTKCPKYAWIYGGSIGLVQFISNKSFFPASRWWNVALFRQRDSDWFAHEGLARIIFNEVSLKGGEPIFYFQPGMRYLITVGHLILGNNDILLPLMASVFLFAAIAVALRQIKIENRLFGFLPVLSISSLIVLFSDLNMSSYIFNLTTELPTWIFLFVFSYLACTDKFSSGRIVILGLVAGLSVNFRPNQSPGWAYLVVIALIGLIFNDERKLSTRRAPWLFVLVTVSSASLSLIHNLYYGRSFVLFSSSGLGSQQHSLKIFFEMFYDADSRNIVTNKFRSLTLFTFHPLPKDRFWPYTNSFQLMHISWLVSLVWACRTSRKYLKTAMFAIVPFMFLLPMVMYDSSSYFPRHLVIINISFLASSLLMLFNAQKVQQSSLAKT